MRTPIPPKPTINPTRILIVLALLAFPSVGYDIYYHTLVSSSASSFIAAEPYSFFGITLPRYILLQYIWLILTLGGILPGLSPAALFIYVNISRMPSIFSMSISLFVRIFLILVLIYNLVFFSASGVSVNLLLLSQLYTKNKPPFAPTLLFLVGSFTSPVGLLTGSVILCTRIFSYSVLPGQLFFFPLAFLSLCIGSTLQSQPEFSQLLLIDNTNIRLIAEKKSVELLMIFTALLLFFIKSKVHLKPRIALRIRNHSTLLHFSFLFLFLSILIFPLTDFLSSTRTFASRPTVFYFSSALSLLFPTHLSYASRKTHSDIFCTSFVSPLVCSHFYNTPLNRLPYRRTLIVNDLL